MLHLILQSRCINANLELRKIGTATFKIIFQYASLLCVKPNKTVQAYYAPSKANIQTLYVKSFYLIAWASPFRQAIWLSKEWKLYQNRTIVSPVEDGLEV